MPKLSFDDALQAIADERRITAADVRADALRRVVWVAEWHVPGCLSESMEVCTSKRHAIEAALSFASGENGPPRGMRADLLRSGRSDRTAPDAYVSMAVTTVFRCTLAELF